METVIEKNHIKCELFVVSLFMALLFSCNRIPSRLEQALALAGENRAELEKVMAYYAADPADSLKYRAAQFLIENMPDKYTLDTLSVAANQLYFDAITTLRRSHGAYGNDDIRRVCDSVKECLGDVPWPQPKYRHDPETVTAQCLIRHIDRSFEAKRASPWADSVTFDAFCRYILPYKTRTNYWEGSQDFFKATYAALPDSIAGRYAVGRYIDADVQESFRYGGGTFFRKDYQFLLPMTLRNIIETRMGIDCFERCCASVDALRSMSIPAALNIIPSWGNAQDSHFLCELIGKPVPERYDNAQRLESKPEEELIRNMYWSERPLTRYHDIPSPVSLTVTRTVPKLFREGYAIQPGSLALKYGKEEIPRIFENPCLEDISARYLVCSDVTVSLDKPAAPRKFAYLCCYYPDRTTLAPVDWAPVRRRKATFRNVGINILYFPAYHINGRMKPAGTPFVLLPGGECKFMDARHGERETVVLYTKFPYRSYILGYANRMLNGRFLTASRPDLSDTTPEGYVTSVTDPLGAATLTEYTPEGDLFREIDAEGNITGYNCNETGQLTSVHYPDGTGENYSYTPEGRLHTETARGGATTIHLYGSNGLRERTIAPDNRVTEYFYNEQNLINRVRNGDREITLSYDAQGNIVEAILPGGYRAEWEYDHRGRVLRSVDSAGRMNRYRYDALDRLVQRIAPDGNLVKLAYNAYDEVVRAEDDTRQVEFKYTPLGSLKTRRENGRTLHFGYNTEEQLTGLRNEAGEQYGFGRDACGRIIAEKGFDGITRTYERDARGLVRHVKLQDGRTTDYIYDTAGRLCGVEYPDGSFEQYAYDDGGRLREAKNANSHLKITRDKLGRIIEEWQDGHTVTSLYDKKTALRTGVTGSLGADLSMDYTAGGLLQGMQSGGGWDMSLRYDSRGLEIERVLSGGVVCGSEYDLAGRLHRHGVSAGGRRTRRMRYDWSRKDRLLGMVNELTHEGTWFDYDAEGNLTGSVCNETEKLFRIPDAVGNLYRRPDRSDRKYGAGGRLLETENAKYRYDESGNLSAKVVDGSKTWLYKWNANGSLREVVRPDLRTVSFEYDALGRRTSKTFDGRVTRWVWDGNTPLHEWTYDEKDRPKTVTDEYGLKHVEGAEPTEDITTWVFEEGSFRPAAKLTKDKNYSIVTDYLGTPAQMYDEKGQLVWEAHLDIYGKVRTFAGRSLSDCPFRYQGQYEDSETGLYYNRFRYYSPEEGMYLSKDPIGLAGNNPTLYGYVKDVNSWIDEFGLDCKTAFNQKANRFYDTKTGKFVSKKM